MLAKVNILRTLILFSIQAELYISDLSNTQIAFNVFNLLIDADRQLTNNLGFWLSRCSPGRHYARITNRGNLEFLILIFFNHPNLSVPAYPITLFILKQFPLWYFQGLNLLELATHLKEEAGKNQDSSHWHRHLLFVRDFRRAFWSHGYGYFWVYHLYWEVWKESNHRRGNFWCSRKNSQPHFLMLVA